MDNRVPPKNESCGFESHQPGHVCSMSECNNGNAQKIELTQLGDCMYLCQDCLKTMHDKLKGVGSISLNHGLKNVPVAQLEERSASTRQVEGASPSGDANTNEWCIKTCPCHGSQFDECERFGKLPHQNATGDASTNQEEFIRRLNEIEDWVLSTRGQYVLSENVSLLAWIQRYVPYLLEIARAAELQQGAVEGWLNRVIEKYGPTADNPKGRFTCDDLNECDRLGAKLRKAFNGNMNDG